MFLTQFLDLCLVNISPSSSLTENLLLNKQNVQLTDPTPNHFYCLFWSFLLIIFTLYFFLILKIRTKAANTISRNSEMERILGHRGLLQINRFSKVIAKIVTDVPTVY